MPQQVAPQLAGPPRPGSLPSSSLKPPLTLSSEWRDFRLDVTERLERVERDLSLRSLAEKLAPAFMSRFELYETRLGHLTEVISGLQEQLNVLTATGVNAVGRAVSRTGTVGGGTASDGDDEG
ncbi:hypothetical protein FRB99_003940, partial [Tulasnella sp. 403]